MSLESCYIVIDNSEHMRNGDFVPTRVESQNDAVNLLATAKTGSNPETTVGLIAMSGPRVEVLSTLTQDPGDLLSAMHELRLQGESDLISGLQVARLALKHRQNKNGGKRIIVFVGSPVSSQEDDLVRLGKQLKKNGIAVDVVAVGEESNLPVLRAFHGAVNKEGNSTLVEATGNGQILADVVMQSALLFGGDGGSGGGGGGSAMQEVDPELAWALQESMREAEARDGSAGGGGAGDAPAAATTTASGTTASGSGAGDEDDIDLAAFGYDEADLDPEMKQAILLSIRMQKEEDAKAAASPGAPAPMDQGGDDGDDDDDDDDETAALLLSQQLGKEADQEAAAEGARMLQDDTYVNDLFSNLPGVDPNDAKIQDALKAIKGAVGPDPNQKDGDEDDGDDKKDGKTGDKKAE